MRDTHGPRALYLSVVFSLCLLAALLPAQDRVHLVKDGETLYSIARLYKVAVADILKANGLKDADSIRAGAKLRIPAAVEETFQHRVAEGETLYGIARSYGLDLEAIKKANPGAAKGPIFVGQQLSIPGRKPVPSSNAGKPQVSPAPSPPRPTSQPRPSPAVPDMGRLDWPVKGKIERLKGKLSGVSILAERGDIVRAVSLGTVVQAYAYRGYGQVVFVESPKGLMYFYGGHESLTVKVGDRVRPGSQLGVLGLDANQNRPIMYFGIYRGEQALDPRKQARE